jgi:hypothetical protein
VIKRIPALLASAAIGVIALTGCSTPSAGAADIGGDPGNRSPMLTGVSAGAPAQTTAGSAVVTPLTQEEFPDQRQSGLGCRTERRDEGTVTYCEELEVVDGVVQWTVYLAVPQSPVNVYLSVSNDFAYTSRLTISDPYVKIVWDKPGIPVETTLSTDAQVVLADDTTYDANNDFASYDLFSRYSEENLVLE